MAPESHWPSKWWFWLVPALATCYLLLLLLIFLLVGLWGLSAPAPLVEVALVLVQPAAHFIQWVVEPVMDAIHLDPSDHQLLAVALIVVMWELTAALVGLLVYGAAALVYAIVPGENGGEGGRTDGS